ncbi:MAG: FtsX-like permease family protein [Nitrospirota bacterium]
MGLATGTLFTATMLLRGVETGIRQGAGSLGADLLVVPMGSEIDTQAILSGESKTMLMGAVTTTTFLKQDVVSQMTKIYGIADATPQLYLSTWEEGACCKMANIQIIGFDPKTDFIVKSLLENKVTSPISADEIILGNNLMSPLAEGEKVSPWPIYGYPFSVVGRLKKTSTGLDWAVLIPLDGIDSMIREAPKYAPPEAAARLKAINPGYISSVLVKINPLVTTPQEMKIRIKMEVPDVMVISTAETVTTLTQQLYTTLKGLLFSALALWVMSILVVGAIFSMIINERRREIGLLRAIGATSVSVFKLIMYESSILTGFGGAIGVALGAGVVYFFNSMIRSVMKMPYVWPNAGEIGILILICLAAGVVAGVLGALYPAVRSSTMEPLNAIRLGE